MPDPYVRRARLAPAVLLAVPGIAFVVAGAVSPAMAARIVGIVLGAVGIVIAIVVRDRGRQLQPSLWRSWGGPPAQRRLRWTGGDPSDVVERLHQRVEAATGEQLPDAEAEARDPDFADRRYDDAVGVLREATRNREEFPLVFEENVDYGFRRNTLGLRSSGITTSVVGLVVAVLLLVIGSGALSGRAARWGPVAGICGLALLFWCLIVTPRWVRTAAENYADRLFGAAASLARETASDA